MANNKKALDMLFDLCEKLENDEIDFIKFLQEGDIILFNKMSINGVRAFSDGWRDGSASNIYQHVLKAYNGDKKALRRLLGDLEIEYESLTIKQVR